MKLVVPNDVEVRLVSLKPVTSKSGNEMTFATIANVETFENVEARLALAVGQSMTDIVVGKNYKAVVDFGQFSTVTLTPVAVAPAPTTPAKVAERSTKA